MGRIKTTALLAGKAGCGGMAFENVSDGVGEEVNAVLGEISGKASASVAGFLVELEHARLFVGVGFFGAGVWGFWGGRAVLARRVAGSVEPICAQVGGGVPTSGGFAGGAQGFAPLLPVWW